MSQCYRIKNWKGCFEVAQNGACKTWSWIAVPIKHDGKSYRRLMSLPNGAALYGAWILIAAVAAKCDTRGMLIDENEPLTAEDLFFKTGAPEELFAEALEVLCSDRIGWLEVVSLEQTQASLEHAQATLERTEATLEHAQALAQNSGDTRQDKTRHNITLQNKTLRRYPSPVTRYPLPVFADEIQKQIPEEWLVETEDAIEFSDASSTVASVFGPISRPSMLIDPVAMRDWWRFQLGCSEPVLGNQIAWCVVALALGMLFSKEKSTRWKSRIGIWSNALKSGYWAQAGPFIPEAVELLRPLFESTEQKREIKRSNDVGTGNATI